MKWLSVLKDNINRINQAYVSDSRTETNFLRDNEQLCLTRKLENLENRKCKIVKSIVDGYIISNQEIDDLRKVDYVIHFQHLIKQNKIFFIEEKLEERRAVFSKNEMVDDYSVLSEKQRLNSKASPLQWEDGEAYRYKYSRLEAVRYAERWWNDYNPQYKKFENNCTNFISQCLRAGGAPMTGYPKRNKGWWFQSNNWSYSWAVAHAFRWYLSGAKSGLRTKEESSPEQLIKGDVICYDFDGDGRWQHSTIVVAKDVNNMPLVNAQTTNSRMRYWNYEDSTAWTPNIKYKFFHII